MRTWHKRIRTAALLILSALILASCAKNKDDESSDTESEGIVVVKQDYLLPSSLLLRLGGEINRFNVGYDGGAMVTERDDGSGQIIEVDELGHLRKEWIYAAGGELFSHREYEYDENGNMVVQIEFEADGSEKYRILHTYGEDGLLLKTVKTDSGRRLRSQNSYAYEYDADGRTTREITYKENGDVKSTREYTYDARGNLVLSSFSDGTLSWQTQYEYDEHGNQTKYSRDGKTTFYTYDESGNRIEEAYYDEDGGLNSRSVYEYTSDGLLQKETSYDADGALNWQYENKYDGHGNLIEIASLFYSYDGEPVSGVTRYQYTYDANGRPATRTELDESGKRHETAYDEAGREIKITVTDKSGKLLAETENAFDEAGHQILYASYDTLYGYEQTSRHIWKYDENGILVQEDEYTSGTGIRHQQYVYAGHDANGNATQTICYYFIDVEALTEYTYNESGKLLTRVVTGTEGEFLEREELAYDADGREVRQTISYREYSTPLVYESTYDEAGIQTKQCLFDNGKPARLYQYDADGRLLKQAEYDEYNGNLKTAQEWEYDADGVLIKEISMHRYTDWEAYEITVYEYDENGRLKRSSLYASEDRDSYEDNRIYRITYAYDAQGWLQDENLLRSGETGEDYHYTVKETCTVSLTEAQYQTLMSCLEEYIDSLK